MQNAKITGINYAGQRPSTLFFERTNKEWLLHNQIATREFLDGIAQNPLEKMEVLFIRIFQFLKSGSLLKTIKFVSPTMLAEKI